MRIAVFPDAASVAAEAACFIADAARRAAVERGRFSIAVSGGRTPWPMLRALADQELPWQHIDIVQTDERVAPAGDSDRNITGLRKILGAGAPRHIHAMPVEERELERAAARYAATLQGLAGHPPVLDVVHLGLGADGHTASLLPDDPVLGESKAEVALTQPYQGRRRMTLTYPVLNLARRIVWLVTGEDKAAMLARLHAGDTAIPAGRVRAENAVVFADRAAASQMGGDVAQARV
jgi:6-phosphogluconolactonase